MRVWVRRERERVVGDGDDGVLVRFWRWGGGGVRGEGGEEEGQESCREVHRERLWMWLLQWKERERFVGSAYEGADRSPGRRRRSGRDAAHLVNQFQSTPSLRQYLLEPVEESARESRVGWERRRCCPRGCAVPR